MSIHSVSRQSCTCAYTRQSLTFCTRAPYKQAKSAHSSDAKLGELCMFPEEARKDSRYVPGGPCPVCGGHVPWYKHDKGSDRYVLYARLRRSRALWLALSVIKHTCVRPPDSLYAYT